MKISKSDFISRDLEPLRYYDVLPSDELQITGTAGSKDAKTLGQALRDAEPEESVISLMDELSIALINEFETLAGDQSWRPIADKMAHWYAQTLRPGGSKGVRMRSQLLNFFLRDILDAGKPNITPVETEQLEALCPWDFLRLPDEEIWLTSDQDNVIRRRSDGSEARLRCGLPTRLDKLTDGRVGIHSLYSDGGWLLDGAQANKVSHHTPVVLFFLRGDRLHLIDFKTGIYNAETKEQVAGPLLEQVHFARFVGDRVILIDCCQIGRLYELDPRTLDLTCHEIEPVLICNDLCQVDNRFYLIDKEQGSVFAFDENFNFLDQRLAFGRAAGRLWDPAAIRNVQGRLQVLNWFTSSIVTLDPF